LLQLPDELCGGRAQFVLLSWIVQAHVAELFPGMNVTGCYPFRLTRNSELWVEEEEVEDLLHAVLGELPRRRYGEAVRLEVTLDCPLDMAQFLLAQFGLAEADLYRVAGPVNLPRLDQIHARVNRPELKYRGFTPGVPRGLSPGRDIFAQLRAGDLLLNHPFHSFGPVIDFLRQAAADPDVLAIKQTLYRAGADSPLVEALIEAAHAGKEVTVVVELMARFDEANNADLASRLQDAGVNVLYGVVGYKTHAKMLLVVRRESKKLRRYVHVGTGNYHPGTARAYTDLSLLTCDKDVGEDVHQLFLQLTGLGRALPLRKLIQAPFHMQGRLLELIEAEARHARAGKRARIVAKMNSLCEPQVIRALYAASRDGVQIDLIVRGICSLRPGVAGLSERIRVRSITAACSISARTVRTSCTSRAPTGCRATSSSASSCAARSRIRCCASA
jgi:polyphosphate kinase